jgi:hypothetical protein
LVDWTGRVMALVKPANTTAGQDRAMCIASATDHA